MQPGRVSQLLELGYSQAECLSYRTQVLSDNTLSPLVGGKLGFLLSLCIPKRVLSFRKLGPTLPVNVRVLGRIQVMAIWELKKVQDKQ